MPTKSASPRSQQRLRIFDAYRGRGHRNNNLWLVYSVKTERDWILSSDRQLIHWIHYLEVNPAVASFSIRSNNNSRVLLAGADAAESGHSFEVIRRDGGKEWHQLGVFEAAETTQKISEKETHLDNFQTASLRYFGDADLMPHITVAMHWLKAIAYAATIREQNHTPLLLTLLPLLKDLKQGSIRDVSDHLPEFDPAILMGLIVRLAIQGHLHVDLIENSFCRTTPWYWCEDVPSVVA